MFVLSKTKSVTNYDADWSDSNLYSVEWYR